MLSQTNWAIVVMVGGMAICALAGLCESRSRTAKAQFPSIIRADKWHWATIGLGVVGILTWFAGFYILVNR